MHCSADGERKKRTVDPAKKKKKKKKRLPKDLSKPIDPERWLPMRERSYFRGRRAKGKGTRAAYSYICMEHANLCTRFFIGGTRTIGAQGLASVSIAHQQAYANFSYQTHTIFNINK